jgi:hypothetical protein
MADLNTTGSAAGYDLPVLTSLYPDVLDTLRENIKRLRNGYVAKAGDTMTGALQLQNDWNGIWLKNSAGGRVGTYYARPTGGFIVQAHDPADSTAGGPTLSGAPGGLLDWNGAEGIKTGKFQIGDTGSLLYTQNNGDIVFRAGSGNAYFELRKDGTFVPTTGGIATKGSIMAGISGDPGEKSMGFNNAYGSAYFFFQDNGNLGFYDAVSTRIRFTINTAGDFVTPGAFNSNSDGGSKFTNWLKISNAADDVRVHLRVDPSSGQFQLWESSYNKLMLYCDPSGNLTAPGNITAFSDARLKTDLRPRYINLDSAAHALDVYSYKRTDTCEDGFGGLAQELQAVLPECVQDSNGVLSVDYGRAAYALVVAMLKERAHAHAR